MVTAIVFLSCCSFCYEVRFFVSTTTGTGLVSLVITLSFFYSLTGAAGIVLATLVAGYWTGTSVGMGTMKVVASTVTCIMSVK